MTAITTIDSIFTANASIRDNFVTSATSAIDELRGFINSAQYIPEAPYYNFPNIPQWWLSNPADLVRSRINNFISTGTEVVADMTSINSAPEFTTSQVSPTEPGAPDFSGITPPTFSGVVPTAPTLNPPAAPNDTAPTAPGAAPTFNMPAEPTRPSYTIPSAPSFAAVSIPTFAGLTLPTFSSTLPIDNITAPTDRFSYADAIYDAALQDELKAKILYDLENGGYGIETEDELRLWERARERDVAALGTAVDELARVASTRGFTMPPGGYYAAATQAASDLATKTASMSREIASKRADLYVQNRQFIIQTGVSFEKLLMDFYTSKCERALNVAKLTVTMAIDVFNAQVAKYNMQLEAYKASAQVYETQIKAALANLEVYKAELEGARITVEIQRQQVDIYRVQIQAVEALIGLYQADINVMKTKAEIENLKLSGYRNQVEAYAASVQAYTARFNAYEAQVRGEVAKAQMYESQVRGYTGTIDAEKAKIDAQRAVLEGEIAAKNAEIATFKAQVDWWEAIAREKIGRANAAGGILGTRASAFGAQMNAEAAAANIDVNTQKSELELAQEAARASTQQVIAEAELYIKGLSLREQAAVQTMNGAINVLSAILTAITGVGTVSQST